MQLTRDEEKMLSGGYGKATRGPWRYSSGWAKFYDAKSMVPISMAYLVEGPSVAVPGETVKWLNWMADK